MSSVGILVVEDAGPTATGGGEKVGIAVLVEVADGESASDLDGGGEFAGGLAYV